MKKNIQEVIAILGMIMIPAIIYSTAITTGCIIGFCLIALPYFTKDRIKEFWLAPSFVLFILVFINVLFASIHSENTNEWLHGLTIKLPFLLLPIAFFLLPKIKSQTIIQLHLWLLVVLVISALPVITWTMMHHNLVLDNLSKGQAIPTPVEHVKYSMMNAYGIIAATYLLLKGTLKPKINRILSICGIGFLTVYMHLLSVRTGLVILYVSMPVLIFMMLDSFKIKAMICSLLIGIALISYSTIPSLQHRISYMVYDYNQYISGEGLNYSDSERWIANGVGIDLWLEEPILGTGWGDLRDRCMDEYRNTLQLTTLYKLPHSQYLTTLARSGLLGFILFVVGFFGPWILFKGRFKLLLGMLVLNYALSFLVENSIERSFMVAFLLLFALIIINIDDSDSQAPSLY